MFGRLSRLSRLAATFTVLANTTLGHAQVINSSLPRDSVIEAALGYLTPGECRRIAPIRVARTRPEGVSVSAEAWVRLDAGREIWVAGYSDTYLSAAAGDHDASKKLAGIIMHEQTHVDCGDEKAAYDVEIFILRRLHASAAMLLGVQRTRQIVLAERKGAPCEESEATRGAHK